jgi:alpha-beta hydrolase superfamily lysophospholipase
MAEKYAPELKLRGVVAGAPAAEPDRMLPAAAQFPRAAGFYVLGAKGYAATFPELDEADYFTPEAAQAATVADGACVREVIGAFATYPSGLAPGDLTQDAAVMKRFRQSAAGRRPAGAPLLVVQGTADTIVAKALTDLFVPKACAKGDVVEYKTYEGAGHVDVVPLSKPDMLAWVAARFAGDPAPDTCPS